LKQYIYLLVYRIVYKYPSQQHQKCSVFCKYPREVKTRAFIKYTCLESDYTSVNSRSAPSIYWSVSVTCIWNWVFKFECSSF